MCFEIAKITFSRADVECIPLKQVEGKQWNWVLRHFIQIKAQKEKIKKKKRMRQMEIV